MFRASGGKAIKKQLGFGHVNRCLSLSKALRRSEIFFLIEDYGGVKRFIDNKKINTIYLKNNISLSEDIQKTKKHILEHKIDILIVDKYNNREKILDLAKREFLSGTRKAVLELRDIKGNILRFGPFIFRADLEYEKRQTLLEHIQKEYRQYYISPLTTKF